MRALLLAFLLALATVVPAFADDEGGDSYRPTVSTVDVVDAASAMP
jgi:hypothetical protein